MRRSVTLRTGAVLLEVIVGMTILTIVASAWIALLGQTMQSVHALRMSEEQLRVASAELRRIVLWPRVELDARTGSSRISGFKITVSQPAPLVYAVALHDTATGALVLTTTVYASQGSNAAR